MMSRDAFDKLIRDYQFTTVLDVGAGQGLHSRAFRDAGKQVTAIDIGRSVYYEKANENFNGVTLLREDFNNRQDKPMLPWSDVVWCSHVLEHQRNPGEFLERCMRHVRPSSPQSGPGGYLAVTVPPLKHNIVGGHVTLWNAGLLLYQLILAGIDCSQAAVKTYGYNISVIVERKEPVPRSALEDLHYDSGDILRLSPYFPIHVTEGFDGRIAAANW